MLHLPLAKFFSLILFGLLLTSCHAQTRKSTAPPGYDLSKPIVLKLPKEINEISGIAYDERDQSVYAIDDNRGDIFQIPLKKDPVIKKWEFGKAKDYEEVVLHNNRFYVLISNGTIVSFPRSFPVAKTNKEDLPIKGKNEFEILFKDPSSERLLMMCKECAEDKKNKVSVYAYNIAGEKFAKKPDAELNVKDIEDKLGKKIGRFKPSAANVHPQTKEVYIVSSINKLLVVTDSKLSVKKVYALDAGLFKQPEGLCFTPTGDLLISNEAASKGPSNILLFRFKP